MKICGQKSPVNKTLLSQIISRLFGYWIIGSEKNISLLHCAWWKFKIFDGTQSLYFFFISLFFLIVGPTWTGKSGFSFCLHIEFNVLGYVYYFGINYKAEYLLC